MPQLVRLYDLDPGTTVRDAAFVDEDHILFTTPRGDGWLAGTGRGLLRPRRLFAYADLLAARRFVAEPVDPAPPPVPSRARIAVSAALKRAAVKTEDLLVFLVPLDGREPPALPLAMRERDAVPRFSADGRHLALQADLLHVLDARTYWTVDYAFRACDWHPSEPRLLVLDRHDRLSWVTAGPVRFQPLGTIDPPETRRDPVGMAVAPDADACVIAFPPDRLEWWALDPPRLLDTRRASTGCAEGDPLVRLIPSPDRRFLAVIGASGMRLWDVRTRQPVGDAVPGVVGAAFSPSGRRLLAITRPEREDGREPPASAWAELAALVCTVAGRPRATPNLSLREIRPPPARP